MIHLEIISQQRAIPGTKAEAGISENELPLVRKQINGEAYGKYYSQAYDTKFIFPINERESRE